MTKEPRNDERNLLHCYGQQLWFNCLPGTLMNRYSLRMRGQDISPMLNCLKTLDLLIQVTRGQGAVENSPNPSSVYIRLCKHREKVFYCFYKITFLRKNAQLFVMAMIKREILTSRKVLYTKSCTRNQFLFCKKMLSKIRIFLA